MMSASRWLRKRRGLALLLMLLSGGANAHEFRPAYLQVDAQGPQRYALAWHVAEADVAREALRLVAAPGCRLDVAARGARDRLVLERYALDCTQAGEPWLEIDGLAASMTDVLVKRIDERGERFEHLHGGRTRLSLAPSTVAASAPPNLFAEGVAHVFGGYDHLAYILLLYLWLRRRWRDLVLGVTAFTVAHSASLALATLGLLKLPARPVEAVIALTIGYFALAIARRQSALDVPARHWLSIVLGCGLIHGLGFANSLSTVGLEGGDLMWGLLSFNLGIEAAQLAIIAALTCTAALAGPLASASVRGVARYGTAVVLGGVSVMWYLQRLAA
jgi:hypothetical protein